MVELVYSKSGKTSSNIRFYFFFLYVFYLRSDERIGGMNKEGGNRTPRKPMHTTKPVWNEHGSNRRTQAQEVNALPLHHCVKRYARDIESNKNS